MPERSAVIDGKLVTNPVGERIESGYIHIYPGIKMSIKLARCFTDELQDLGYRPVERTDDRATPVDLPVNIIITNNEMLISFYRNDLGVNTKCKLHNYVIENLGDYIEGELRKKADVVSRVKFIEPSVVIGEPARVIHIYFDLNTLEKIGKKEENLDGWFG